MNRVIHFDLYAKEPERAIKFYQEVFGWQFEKFDQDEVDEEYWQITTGQGDGIDGGMIRRKGMEPEKDSPIRGFICSIGVESIDETLEKVLNSGGEIVLEKIEVEDFGAIATLRDTEGNSVGLMEKSIS